MPILSASRSALRQLFELTVEALFPLSPAERALFALSPAEAVQVLPRAPQPPFPDMQAIYAYKDERVAKMVWNIKYKKSRKAAAMAAYALQENIASRAGNDRPLIIPLPISRQRRRERGFNQMELVAEELNKLAEVQAEIRLDILERPVHVSRQTLKNRADRLASAQGIFAINPALTNSTELDSLLDREIIVIDDVITTGSTMKEALETLRAAGFKNLRGLAIAH